MQTMFVLFALMVLPVACVVKSGEETNIENSANPIRKVVTMLQNMQKKVAEEAKAEKELFDKYMCYCKTGTGELEASIEEAKAKEPETLSAIEAAKAKLEQAKATLAAALASEADAKAAIKKATALREKENAVYVKESTEYKTNIAALTKAVAALSKGMSGAFLQTFLQSRTAAILKKLAIDGPSMTDEDRQILMSFLSTSQASEYNPRSGEIVGILKTMLDDLQKTLDELTAAETAAQETFIELTSAKKKEIITLKEVIEKAQKAIGDLGIQIQMMKNELSQTAAALAADTEYLAGLSTDCDTKESEWPEIEKLRAEEQVALAETIKVLNDDDTLEMFKKTLPGASFLQTAGSAKAMKAKAVAILEQVHKPTNAMALKFVETALKGKIGFDKIFKMIDEMVEILKQEQMDDDEHKVYCAGEIDKVAANIKGSKGKLSDLEDSIETTTESIATLKEEIKKLADGVKALDKSVEEATEQRKAERAEYEELMKGNSMAKEVLAYAKNRLNKFYNPSMYKAPEPKAALVQGAPAFMQVGAHQMHHDKPAPPPASFGKFVKQDAGGPIAMIDAIITDLDKEMTVAGADEKVAQKQYEDTVAEAIVKKKADTELIVEKDTAKAEFESELRILEIDEKSTKKELLGHIKYQKMITSECEFLLSNYEVRKQARSGEVDALKNAKRILKGADSFLQSTEQVAQRSQKALRR